MTVTTNKGKTRGRGGGGVREGGCIEGKGVGVTDRILIFRLCETESELCFFFQKILACLFMLSRSA